MLRAYDINVYGSAECEPRQRLRVSDPRQLLASLFLESFGKSADPRSFFAIRTMGEADRALPFLFESPRRVENLTESLFVVHAGQQE
jgi:hypothetical protein